MRRTQTISLFLFSAGLAMISACATPEPRIQTGPGAEVTFDDLHRVDHSVLQRAWVKPGASLAAYQKLLLVDAGIHYKRPPSASRHARGNFALTEQQRAELRQLLREAFVTELTRDGGWELVEEPGPDVLMIRGALIDLVVHAPPESASVRDRVYIDSVAEATLVAEFYDSESREILARVADRRSAEPALGGMRSLPVTNRAEVKRLLDYWARLFRERLDVARTVEMPAAR